MANDSPIIHGPACLLASLFPCFLASLLSVCLCEQPHIYTKYSLRLSLRLPVT